MTLLLAMPDPTRVDPSLGAILAPPALRTKDASLSTVNLIVEVEGAVIRGRIRGSGQRQVTGTAAGISVR